ncbi:hypothetical protein FWF74_04135 [Candidatus Saccharibacteria bacterium]|nr:hypothetical protein [Candidatus Saccharibacteria bacterium]MCL1962754.1 hypothetical protein [Candidatus Saccharibacteria bacterium]
MWLFILGRQPEIGIAELRAVFGNAVLVLPNVALVYADDKPNIDRLGGVRKVGRVIYDNDGNPGKFLIDRFSDLPGGKITLGVSHYGKTASASNAQKTGAFIKKNLGRSVRILPNMTAEISDAATLGNKLGTSPNKIELLMVYIGHRLIIAELVGVQDLNAYTLRDRGRPKRDARVGMLPPKLAQIMINLSGFYGSNFSDFSPSESETYLLDPFCGTGVILQEALVMGIPCPFGTDIEPRMIEYTDANLDWLIKKFGLNDGNTAPLYVADATNENWLEFRRSLIEPESDAKKLQKCADLVVTETYLGRPYATAPSEENLRENIANCELILTKFLKNLEQQITPKTGICLAVPCWFVGKRTLHLKLIDNLTQIGFEQIFYSSDKKPLIYHRENQIVGRELLVLRKKEPAEIKIKPPQNPDQWVKLMKSS